MNGAGTLRIVHVTNEPFGFATANGVQQVVYALAHAQAQLEHSVAVVTRDDLSVRLVGSDRTFQDPARVAAATASRSGGLFVSRYFEPVLSQRVDALRPDIVHFHSVHIPQNVALAASLRQRGIRYCVTVHGGLFPPALRRRPVKKRLFKWLFERAYLSDAHFVQAVSDYEAVALREYGITAPVIVIPNGLPPHAEEPPTEPDALVVRYPALRGRRVLLFVGRLDPWQKSLDLLIEAFARERLGGEAALVFVGPDWFGSRERLTRLARRCGVFSDVLFLPPVFGPERANLFAAADVFVHPSRWEGLSLSVLAAAAASKPCVLTRVADPFHELERAGAAILVNATVHDIAAGLRRAVTLGTDELREMGRRGHDAVASRFSWREIAQRLADAYRDDRSPTG
jgi:glycosyltransferase involved in cell wall biosynthesis